MVHGPTIAPDTPRAERADYGEVILERRLRRALERLNSNLPVEALDDAFRKLTRPEGATLEVRNRAFHLFVCSRSRLCLQGSSRAGLSRMSLFASSPLSSAVH